MTLLELVEFEKYEKLVTVMSVDVIENECSAEVSEISKEMIGAIAFRRRAMQRKWNDCNVFGWYCSDKCHPGRMLCTACFGDEEDRKHEENSKCYYPACMVPECIEMSRHTHSRVGS